MNKTLLRYLKGFLFVILLFGLFVVGVILEAYWRASQRESIPVESSEIPEITITASREPDFMGGTAWWIDYKSAIPFELDAGFGSTRVPAGTHKIYSNHDHSNLDEYGLKFSGEVPEKIVARPSKR